MWLLTLLLATVFFIVIATSILRVHPFLVLLLAAFGYGIFSVRLSLAEIVAGVNEGFGKTVGTIGIVILAGSIIGTFLEKSGGARRVAERCLAAVGRKNVPLALAIMGYIVSIPVFCDSGFVILAPLAIALSRQARVSVVASAIALSLGLYATHTMVPPTPGPVAAAGILHADLGLVILWGLLVSAVALVAGWLFAVLVAAKTMVSVSEDAHAEAVPPSPLPIEAGPSASAAVAPIILPLVLIVLRSIANLPSRPLGTGANASVCAFLGEPVVALLMGAGLSFALPRRKTLAMYSANGWVGEAVAAVATIIIITGCGGALGNVLGRSGIGDVVDGLFRDVKVGIWLPFLIAAALKTAQGSSTVAIMTTAGIVEPLLPALGLAAPQARALAVVAIGAGSMVASHANDSYFWVVTQLSGLSVKDGYRLQTLGTLIEGCVAGGVVWLLSLALL